MRAVEPTPAPSMPWRLPVPLVPSGEIQSGTQVKATMTKATIPAIQRKFGQFQQCCERWQPCYFPLLLFFCTKMLAASPSG